MNALSKHELVEAIANTVHGEAGTETKTAIQAFLDALSTVTAEQLADGKEVTIPGCVKLTPTDQPARKGRNPATGEAIDIPAKRVVKAKVNKALRDAVLR